jgi:hypothetical protein
VLKRKPVLGVLGLLLVCMPCTLMAQVQKPSGSGGGGTRTVAQTGPAAKPLLEVRVDPQAFGISDTTITVISAAQFVPQWTGGVDIFSPVDLPSLSRYCLDCGTEGLEYFASLDLPAGAVIDFIGLNSATDTNAVLGSALWLRDKSGNVSLVNGFSVAAHGFDTDYVGPLNYLVASHLNGNGLVLNVEQAPSATSQYFGFVEVWWHRTVSDPPASASFNDVPTNHPFFQFIEALRASGITGGCGASNYCPDNPVTRGQMAVFLAKALGLHWPY